MSERMEEEEAKPPRRISDAPSARNLKPRHRVSAVRRWPPGCGRFPSPSPSLTPIPSSSDPPQTLSPLAAAPPVAVTLPPECPPDPAPSAPPAPAPAPEDNLPAVNVQPPNANILTDTADDHHEDHEDEEEEEDNNKEQVKGNVDLTNKRWMNSKVYPPPKRRSVSAVRRYPPGCGRPPHFCLGLVEPSSPEEIIHHQDIEADTEIQDQIQNDDDGDMHQNPVVSHDDDENDNENENDEISAGMDDNENDEMSDDQDDNENDEMSAEVGGVPVENENEEEEEEEEEEEDEEDQISLEEGDNSPVAVAGIDANVQSLTDDDDTNLKDQQLPVDDKQESMQNSQITEPNPNPGEVLLLPTKEPQCEVVSMDVEPLVNDTTAEPDTVEPVTVQKPKSEGSGENTENKREKKKPGIKSDINDPKSEHDKPSDVAFRQKPGESVTTKEPECAVVRMDEEPVVNDATARPDIVECVAIHKPKSEGLREKIKKIKEEKKPGIISETENPKLEQDKLLDVPFEQKLFEPSQHVDSQPAKEMVVFSERMPQKDKSTGSKRKEKVVLRKKVVAKKKVIPKLGQKHDDDMITANKDTRLVPFQICNDEDATMGPHASVEIVQSQIRPVVCAKKSVAGSSRPCLTEGKTKKTGRRVAKKSTRPGKDDSSYAQQRNLMTLTLPPVTPSDGERQSTARTKVKKILRLFQVVCRMLIRKEESGSGKQAQTDEIGSESKSKGVRNRIDLKAAELVKKSDEYMDPGDPVVGHLPGIEVGNEFRYRVELHLVGLHRPLQSGIDWTKVNGVPVATSIVASGGYADGMDGSDVLIYTGAGGKPSAKKGKRSKPEDQKLERGNLALKNSMDMKMPVRVIHGLNTSDTSKVVMTFTYDGLYMVEELNSENETYKFEGQEYKVKVFRYRLRRMPGQPELGLHVATKSKKSKVREGLCVPDISQGMEKIPICAINTIDDEKPPAFKYVTNMIYPSWYEKTAPKGCDCTAKCSSSKRCLCGLKNGGDIPFNFSGAIVQAKQLIYECGPSCRCPPSCHNRVSQNGIRIPLEIFKTENRGWGVRSLSSISSGSFVCEYVGELLRDEVAESRGNDEYLFDIGHNYDDADLWKGLPSLVPGIGSAGDSGGSASEGLTIDAAEMGNVGRFINHCCSPNLYAQNVLYDHDDRRMPHIMFFAAENIPPLQELTYHYNYDIGQVRDSQGNEKIKKCYCGSLECDGRLY